MFNMSRGILYKHMSCFQYQPYLDILTIDTPRISLTNQAQSFITYILQPLRQADEKKTNLIPRNERLCKECNTVEDEYMNFDFVCEYSLYVDLRCKYIPAYYRQILRTVNTFTLKRLRTFIFKVFEIRNINNYT